MDVLLFLRRLLAVLVSAAALLACIAALPLPATAANYRLGKNYGGDFTLVDHEGRPFSLRDVRGKVVLLHFGFTSCDSTCPATMTRVSAALEQLGPKAALVQPLLVTIDAKRDSPAVLREYVRNFHPSYIGLTGSQREVTAVARQYRAPVHVHDGDHRTSYVADHGSGLYVIARDGMLADIVLYRETAADIARKIAGLLAD